MSKAETSDRHGQWLSGFAFSVLTAHTYHVLLPDIILKCLHGCTYIQYVLQIGSKTVVIIIIL